MQGDSVESVRMRLQERLGVPDKEFEKYRVAVVNQENNLEQMT